MHAASVLPAVLPGLVRGSRSRAITDAMVAEASIRNAINRWRLHNSVVSSSLCDWNKLFKSGITVERDNVKNYLHAIIGGAQDFVGAICEGAFNGYSSKRVIKYDATT